MNIIRKRNWSVEALEALEIDPAWMPPTYEDPETTVAITVEAACLNGLKAGILVVAGGGDQAAQAVGSYWPGEPNDTTVFPQFLEVDYVRVYQRPEDR